MLSSNSSLIKNTQLSKEVVHIDEHLHSKKQDYIIKTAKLDLEKQISSNKEIAEKIISEAKEQADLIIALAQDEVLQRAKSEVEHDIRKALEEEFSNLYEAKLNEVAALYEQANNYVKSVSEELKTQRLNWIELNKNVIENSILKAVSMIIDQSEITPNEISAANFEQALSITENLSETIWVKVHPMFKEYLTSKGITDERIYFIADSKLAQNDFIIELDDEIIDSTLDSKLANLKSILSKWVNTVEIN